MPDRLLICTDMDRTLIPNGPQPESLQAMPLFKKLVSRENIALAYVTGRDKKLVQEAIKTYDLPVPDYAITDVGTAVYAIQSSQWERCGDWEQKIAGDWKNKKHQELAVLLSDLDECLLQEKEKQSLYKLSYYVSLKTDPIPLVKEIQLRMKRNGVQANTVWSIDEQKKTGLLDVLPAGADKRKAVEFLMEMQSFDHTNTVFSGDSGNDLIVLVSPLKSILVANASDQLKSDVKKHADRNDSSAHLYIACGGYQNMNGNYAAGILEGLNHYFPELNLFE